MKKTVTIHRFTTSLDSYLSLKPWTPINTVDAFCASRLPRELRRIFAALPREGSGQFLIHSARRPLKGGVKVELDPKWPATNTHYTFLKGRPPKRRALPCKRYLQRLVGFTSGTFYIRVSKVERKAA